MTTLDDHVHGPRREKDGALARALFPDLASRVDAAANPDAVAGGRHEDPIDAWISGEVARMHAGELDESLSEHGSDAEQARLRASMTAVEAASEALGVRVPSFDDLRAAGVRAARLDDRGTTSASHPLDMLLPVLAPHGLGLGVWQRFFGEPRENLEESQHSLVRGLVVANEVERWFSALDRVQDAALPRARVPGPLGEITWTLRWIPAAPTALLVGRPYRDGPHPTLPELLMLQWIRQQFGDEPIDAQSLTWVAGDLPEPRLAARHTYDAADGLIRINTRERTDQGPHIGTRPPIG